MFPLSRLSAVYENNQIDEIHELLSHDTDASQNLTDTTIMNLELDNAHQISNFVVKCEWQGESCKNNFTLNHLDYGVCFTFNGKNTSNPIKTTGSDQALELVLNSETYDYMVGFNIGTGIQLSIHDQDVYPAVTESGNAISTDTYAVVSVQKKVVNNLEKPHGQCEQARLQYFDYKYTIAACHLECKISEVIAMCHCVMPYMPKVDKTGQYQKI
ncbi:hypothetical protein ScPMuIL_000621 [Solemya velum]